jgi:hypothetical protein
MKNILTAVVCLISVASAVAESGQFETVSGGIVTATTNDYGNSKYSITNVTYSTLVIKSNVSFLTVGDISVSQCLGTITIENSNASGGGSCLATNADGDKWRLNYVRVDGTPQSVTGTAEFIGLTGKFANVKGPCNYEQKRLVKDGAVHVTTLLKCSVSK